MNFLEHYVTNITHVEPIEKNGMLLFKVVCDVDCYGNKEIQKEVLLSEDDYAELGRSAYGFEIDRNFYERAKNEMLVFEKDEQMDLSDYI